MAPIAAVMTGPGAGAIATIALAGDSAQAVLRNIFRRSDGKPVDLTAGRIFLGDIVEGQQTIDQVTVGCEEPDSFAIHCHGNPLIVDRIMGLLRSRGVQLVRPEQLITRGAGDSVAAEAKLALTTVKTVEGATLIANQGKGGLAAKARRWLAELDSTPLEQIAAEARQILHDSDKARPILSGCTVALVGPPNTGKSTLLNALAGREKAIVTDVRGTTRDWVTAEIRIPPLVATIIDTAGLDSELGASGGIDHVAQEKSIEALERADLVLLVLDASQPTDQLSRSLADRLVNRGVITVLNKADLPHRLDPMSLPAHLRQVIHISAKQEVGIDDLTRVIREVCGVADFSLNTIVTFTDRQRALVQRLAASGSPDQAGAWIADLLHGPII
ncbi:MAG: GTP-binding protein [Planctomycetes bacterium]|nr:GTP-binding protein [Planctomycetota bacterium]